MKSSTKYVLILVNCLLTFVNQYVYHYIPSFDSLVYLQLADQFTHFNFLDPATNCYGHPFYAFFLALFGAVFSYHPYIIGFVQSLVFCFSALWLTGELEKLLQRNLSGVVILLFLVPEIHFFNGYVITESLTFTLVLLSFYAALKIYNTTATVLNVLLLSMLVSFALLTRLETAVMIFPLFFLIYPKIKGEWISRTLLFISLPLLLLHLNGLRNHAIFGVYKMSAFNGGEVLYGGNNDNLDGSHHVFWEHKKTFIPPDKIDALDTILAEPVCKLCPERDSFFVQLAIGSWKKDPVKQMSVIPAKLAKNWLLPGNFDIYTADTSKTRGLQIKKILSKEYFNNVWYAPYKHLFYMILHWLLLLMLVAGILQADRRNRFQQAVLLLLIFYLLFAIPFCGLPRWHVTIFPLLIITFTPVRVNDWINRIFMRFLKP